VGVESGQTELLTDLGNQACEREGNGDFWPNWSPDGKQIAFGRKLNGKEQIAILDLTTNEVQILNTGGLPVGHPRWSADGQQILFHEAQEDTMSLVRYDLKTGKTSAIDTSHSDSHLADWR